MSVEDRAIKLLREIPDDMDYPTDRAFRIAFNTWYWDNVKPFLSVAQKEIYRHVASGNEYELVSIARIQSEDWQQTAIEQDEDGLNVFQNKSVDMYPVVVYRSVNDPEEFWARPNDEFFDGRFERVKNV